jgi:hypothetical protein
MNCGSMYQAILFDFLGLTISSLSQGDIGLVLRFASISAVNGGEGGAGAPSEAS